MLFDWYCKAHWEMSSAKIEIFPIFFDTNSEVLSNWYKHFVTLNIKFRSSSGEWDLYCDIVKFCLLSYFGTLALV